ncbi:MAG: PadR family transcriptional regulator [Bacteroidetes bacterium]|nr:PadR family transcriptional regulator [Bacteroidota bacterium]
MKGTYLGEFEELVLLMVVILQEEAYVFKIREEILEQLDRAVAMGALHATLARLEKKGFLNSDMTGATQERGGRRKRVYQLTSSGKEAVKKVREIREKLWDQVPPVALNFRYG